MQKEVHAKSGRMEHLISNIQEQKINSRVNCKSFATRGRKPQKQNQIIENHIIICEIQNVSNTVKYIQTNPKEINVTKSVNNLENWTLDNEPMSDEPLGKKQFALDQSKNRWLSFKKKIMKNICNIKIIQQNQTTKMDPSFQQTVLMKLI